MHRQTLVQRLPFFFVWILALATATPASPQSPPAPTEPPTDSLQAGRFDGGRMWTFEHPPIDYFREAYHFNPDSSWFDQARLATLRVPGCSAAFVSPHGLAITNHHCVRSKIDEASQDDEALLDDGYYAVSLDAERPLSGYYVEQLIAIEDVTSHIHGALQGIETDSERAERRHDIIQQLTEQITASYGAAASGIRAEIVPLYAGGLYSAYVYHRFDDVRLVMAPEWQIAFFGRSTDNFTFPQHALDFALLRVYDDGRPLATDHYFPWTDDGIDAGSPVFVIGNPGSTARLATVAQLTYERDIEVPATLAALGEIVEVTQDHMARHPKDARWMRTRLFSMLNAQKSYKGRLAALQDPDILARRQVAERELREAIESDSALSATYGGFIDRLAEIQQRRREQGDAVAAFAFLTHNTYSSATIRRALLAAQFLHVAQRGSADQAAALKADLLAVHDQPEALERKLIALRLAAFEQYFGSQSVLVRQALQGMTAEARADQLQKASALSTARRTAEALEAGTLHDDHALRLVEAFLPRLLAYQSAWISLNAREREIAGQLGQARYAISGPSVPPDATFTLRITDGEVTGYTSDGTTVPAFTTYDGLYEQHAAHGPDSDWDLPDRWLAPPVTFDRNTPLNFVSTADTIGGSSGSPVVDRDLELVGINFDRNLEGLSRDYIYLDEQGRNVSVDARAIMEALTDIYHADRLVLELTTGRLVDSEAEASDSSQKF